MTVSSIDSSLINFTPVNTTRALPTAGADSDGDNDGSSSGPTGIHQGGGGGALRQSLMQALSQFGLNPAAGASAFGVQGSTATGSDGDNDASGTYSGASTNSTVSQSLQAFMHSLLQTLRQENAGPSASSDGSGNSAGQAASSPSSYSPLSTDMQRLIQTLNSGSTSAGNLGNLQAAFQNLVATLQNNGTGVAAGNAQAPDLQTVLQSILQNLPSDQYAASAAVGGTVNISA